MTNFTPLVKTSFSSPQRSQPEAVKFSAVRRQVRRGDDSFEYKEKPKGKGLLSAAGEKMRTTRGLLLGFVLGLGIIPVSNIVVNITDCADSPIQCAVAPLPDIPLGEWLDGIPISAETRQEVDFTIGLQTVNGAVTETDIQGQRYLTFVATGLTQQQLGEILKSDGVEGVNTDGGIVNSIREKFNFDETETTNVINATMTYAQDSETRVLNNMQGQIFVEEGESGQADMYTIAFSPVAQK